MFKHDEYILQSIAPFYLQPEAIDSKRDDG